MYAVLLVTLAVLVIISFLTDYSNMRIILLSFLGAVLISFLWGKLIKINRRFWVWIALLTVCFVFTIFGFVFLSARMYPTSNQVTINGQIPPTCDAQPPQYSAELKSYDVLIEPVKIDNKISGTFEITDTFHYDLFEKQWDGEACQYSDWILIEDGGVTQNKRSVESEELSLINHKVVVNVSNYVAIPLPDGKTKSVNLCEVTSCVETIVSLEEMPLGSIGVIQYGTLIEGPINEIDIQRAKWRATNINRGIQFSFVPYPFHLVREIIDPLLNIKSLPSFVIAIASGLGGIIVKPVLEDISRNKFKAWVEKRKKNKE